MKTVDEAEAAIKSLFETMTAEIFDKAGITKEDFPDEWEECCSILNMQMARSSAFFGLSKKRVDIMEKQKKTLVEDLIKLKKRKLN